MLLLLLVSVASMAAWGMTSSAGNFAPTTSGERTEEPEAGIAQGPQDAESERKVRREATPVDTPEATPDSPASAAYRSLAGGLPEASDEELIFVQRSVSEPSKSAVWFTAPQKNGRERYFVFFTEKISGEEGGWRTYRSVVAGDQEFQRDIEAMIPNVPEDLKSPVLKTSRDDSGTPPNEPNGAGDPGIAATRFLNTTTEGRGGWRPGEVEAAGGSSGPYRVEMSRSVAEGETQRTQVYLRESEGSLAVSAVGEGLTGAELPGFPEGFVDEGSLPDVDKATFDKTNPVYDGGSKDDLAERGVEEAVEAVEGYPGVAGFYVMDPADGSGYGVRPDEEFFSASTIKVAVMAAVYKKIEAGDLAYSDRIVTTDSDWAAGAGWLRWETPGAQTTVEDALWLMITESDNVATNALTREVGGADYVNSVIREMGAKDTELFWKLSSERAAVPALDNHTTPRDMATILAGIYEGDDFENSSRSEMISLMEQNGLEYWLEGGLPSGVTAANKGGWLDGIYSDVGIVERDEKPYVIAIYTMDGPSMREGSPVLAEISGGVWLAETGNTKERSEGNSNDSGDNASRREQGAE